VVDFNMAEAEIKWFSQSKHRKNRHSQKTEQNCHHFEPNDPTETALHISYNELHERVCKMANVLQDKASKRGSRMHLFAYDSRTSCYYAGLCKNRCYSPVVFVRILVAWWQLVLMTALVKWSSPQIIAAIKQLI
jgi:acyl-CoA synthetase (AMP-forming)/AMP-acid ligase II